MWYVICNVCIIIYCGFQEPEIDSESTEGLKPEKFESDIVFDNIHFRYPARPNVQVSANPRISISLQIVYLTKKL